MITQDNLKDVLKILNFNSKDGIKYEKYYQNSDKISIKINFEEKTINYLPFDNRFKSDNLPSIDNPSVGFMAHRETTLNFKDEKAKEVFIDLIAVDKLLEKGYKPEHIVLEPEFKTGHGDKVYGDILVLNEHFENLLLIECKTTTKDKNKSEFHKEWQNMLENGGQLISYQGVRKSKFLCLLSFDLEENKILTYNYIISMLDDENGKKSDKNYKTSSDKDEIFKVWKELYKQHYEEIGIFEPTIRAYKIGVEKPTIADLTPLANRDIDEKRSKWDDELRAHSVNDRNLALAKLMNLFLCKITDELENPQDLQFYWYGNKADNAYKLIDRLQNLFKKGMEKYLNQKITYHSNQSIQNAFSDDFKGIEVQKKIEEIFKELKYFQNGDFNFIEVFNKELFEKNFEILLPIVKSIQGVKFTQIEDANVLGHYFECFINDMPQHEGQYFTPMPLANFMIYSLPVYNDIKMLDYACGVGHFITQFFNFHKDKKGKITALGVEKDTRLAKTSKIATFMNALNADIKAENALKTGIIQNHSFSYLLCNPPYSVDEFLKVLDEKSRNDFELFNKDLNIATNSIECFFIEKASKVLETNALMAIIVPSSVLSKGGIYERTREILLRDFKIIAICEFGSETFYKTGTNVNVIFAIRKEINKSTSINKTEIIADFYKLILENNVHKARAAYKSFDEYLAKYCDFMNYEIKEFNELLELKKEKEKENENNDIKLFENEIFQEYKKDYDALINKETAEYAKKSETYKEKNPFSPSQSFACFARKIEAKKFLNYAQICFDEVLIIKAPTDNKAQKTFLGYEYKDNKKAKKRGLQVLNSSSNELKEIKTPLYNPNDMLDSNKLNYYVLMNFLKNIDNNLLDKDFATKIKNIKNSNFVLPDELKKFANFAPLTALIDFKRADFSNAININNVGKDIDTNSPFENAKYELVKLGDVLNNLGKGKRPASFENKNGEIPFYKSSFEIFKCDFADFDIEAIIIGDGGCANVNYINGKFSSSDHTYIFTANSNALLKFIYILLYSNLEILEQGFKGIAIKNISKAYINNIKIPLPPLDIQQQIVAEYQNIENQILSIQQQVQTQKSLINAVLAKCEIINAEFQNNDDFLNKLPTPKNYDLISWKNVRISEVCEIIRGVTFNKNDQVLNKTKNAILTADNITLENNFEVSKIIYLDDNFSLDGKKKLYKNDIFMCFASGSLLHVGKVAFIENNTEFFAGGFMGILRSKNINSKFLFFAIANPEFKKQLEQSATGSNINNLSSKISYLQIPLPPLDAQEKIVQAINNIEQNINNLQTNLENLNQQQNQILQKYLFN